MAKPESSPQAHEAWEHVVEALTSDGEVTTAPMFGMPSLKRVGGTAFAGLYGECLTVKLSGDRHARALNLAGATLFDPSGKRPMKQWVQVPFARVDEWVELALAARETDA